MFQFKPGDVVYLRASVVECVNRNKYLVDKAVPKPLIVQETLAQTCPGGTQYHYTVLGNPYPNTQRLLDINFVGPDDPLMKELESLVNAYDERDAEARDAYLERRIQKQKAE